MGADNSRWGYTPCLTLAIDRGKEFDLAVCSGSLIEAAGRLFWLTAGHVIHEIEALRATGVRIIARWRDAHAPSVPAIVDGWDRLAVDQNGVDWGLVELHPNHAENLRRSPHYRAFKLADLVDGTFFDGAASADNRTHRVFALGYPREWAAIEVLSTAPGEWTASVSIRPMEMPLLAATNRGLVEAEFGPTEDEFWRDYCWYAHIPGATDCAQDIPPLHSIQGVSGSPVIVDWDGKLVVVGIVTAWLRNCRVIRVLPIAFPRSVLEHYLAWLDQRSAQGSDAGIIDGGA